MHISVGGATIVSCYSDNKVKGEYWTTTSKGSHTDCKNLCHHGDRKIKDHRYCSRFSKGHINRSYLFLSIAVVACLLGWSASFGRSTKVLSFDHI